MSEPIPLIVDLDGTLIQTDTLVESIRALLKEKPLFVMLIPLWLLGGRFGFKAKLAGHIKLDPSKLPFDRVVLDYVKKEKQHRPVILMTAAHQSIAKEVSDYLGIFDEFYGSMDHNLKGLEKVKLLKQMYPKYAYAGNSTADLPVWKEAEEAIIVFRSLKLLAQLEREHSNIVYKIDRTG